MKNSELLNNILIRAEQIHTEQNTNFVSAPCVIIAVSELCNKTYAGLTRYDKCPYPEQYEEERLRYAYKKVFRAGGQLVGNYFRKLLKTDFSQYDTDFLNDCAQFFEKEAALREKDVLSADIVFLFAVGCLKPEHRVAAFPEYKTEFSVTSALLDIDKNIYDFVINEIEKITQKLQLKADEAKSQRDWRPASKVFEPESLPSRLFSSVKTEYKDNCLEIVLPYFFAESGGLRLSICRSAGAYFVHDNGCALKVLRHRTETDAEFKRVFDRIRKNLSLDGDKTVGCFCQTSALLHYLQVLIFVAHADLYYENLHEEGLYSDSDNIFPEKTKREPFDAQKLIKALTESVVGRYDKNIGLYLAVLTIYSLNSATVSFLIDETADGRIEISDCRKGLIEGEIFESLYWDNDDITPYSSYISRFCERFGAELRQSNVYLTAENKNSEDFAKAMFKFFNLAVLLSELGRMIEPPAAE